MISPKKIIKKNPFSSIKQASKKLKPNEIKALMAETQRILASSAPNDTRAQSIMGDAPEGAKPQKFQWQNFEQKELQEFLAARAEDQPEMIALNDTIHELSKEVCQKNHGAMDAQYDQRITAGKVEAAFESGDLGLLEKTKLMQLLKRICGKIFMNLATCDLVMELATYFF